MDGLLLSTAILVHIGALFYVAGFLVRDELILRLLVLGGTGFYILYYAFHPETPLWDAIITTTILGSANLLILAIITFERTTLALSDDEKKLYQAFDTLSPGQFRKILKKAKWQTANGGESLTEEGKPLNTLYYLFDGQAEIKKGRKKFKVPSGIFLGEIAFILGSEASASVQTEKDMRYVEWDHKDLRDVMSKSPNLHNAIIALFNKDLASKLAVSYQ